MKEEVFDDLPLSLFPKIHCLLSKSELEVCEEGMEGYTHQFSSFLLPEAMPHAACCARVTRLILEVMC